MSGTNAITVQSFPSQRSTGQQPVHVGNNSSSTTNAATTTTPTSTTINNSNNSTSSGAKVSIIEDASTMNEQAYDPNPINIKAGDSVIWTNDDSQPHTVTSGTDSSDPNTGEQFDSSPGLNSLLSTNQTFSHKFNIAGEFPYFCLLHPNMIGKVIVS